MDARGSALASRVTPAPPEAARLRLRRERLRDRMALAPALVVLVTLFGGALLGALRSSVTPLDATGVGDAGLATWRALLHDPAFLDAIWFCLLYTSPSPRD